MKQILLSSALFSLLGSAVPTSASDMRGVVVMSGALVCMHQDAKFRKSLWGKMMESHPRFTGWADFEAMPVSKCLRERQWVGHEFCAAVVETEPENRQQVDALGARYRAEIMALEPLSKLLHRDPEKFVCPDKRPE